MPNEKEGFLSNIVPAGEMGQSVSAHGVVYSGENTDKGCGPMDYIGQYGGKVYGTQKKAYEGMDDYMPPENFWKK